MYCRAAWWSGLSHSSAAEESWWPTSFCAPAIRPEILIRSDPRDPAAAQTPDQLDKAAELRARLAGKYSPYVDCDDPEVIVRARSYKNTDYLFVVNDHRRAGNYLGQHGVVKEYGVSAEATVSLARPGGGHVYDLVTHEAVPATVRGRHLRVDVNLGPCQGRLLMVTDREIAAVGATAPEELRRGAPAEIRIAVIDSTGVPVDAVVPVEVSITDPAGRPGEFSGFYGAKDGRLTIKLFPAPNDAEGTWTLSVRELASGHKSRVHLRLVR